MSEVTTTISTDNQLTTNYDVSKLALGQNSFIKGDVTASGADVDLTTGMVMGRVSATQKIVPLASAATDGSQYPVGVSLIEKTVADGTTYGLNMVNKGRIAEEKVNFAGAETLSTVVDGRSLRDWINDIGLELILGEELTGFDN